MLEKGYLHPHASADIPRPGERIKYHSPVIKVTEVLVTRELRPVAPGGDDNERITGTARGAGSRRLHCLPDGGVHP